MPLPTIVFDPSVDPTEPIVQKLIWATDLMVSRDRHEQRRSLRRAPAQVIQYTVDVVDAAEMARLDALLQAGAPDGFKVPIWCDRYVLPSSVNAGSITPSIPWVGYGWTVGDEILFYQSPRSWELVTVGDISSTSLTARWPFNGDTLDVSGNGRHGTMRNIGGFTAGRSNGQAVLLDGLNDYVEVADTASLKYTGQNFGISVWINPDLLETTNGYIFSKPWNANGQYNWQLQYGGTGTIQVLLLGATSYALATTATIPPGSGWHHIAVVINSTFSSVEIYIDGVSRASGTHSIVSWVPTLSDTNQPLAIGTIFPYGDGWAGDATQAFGGAIDDPRIYSRLLTTTEINVLAGVNVQTSATAATWPAGTLVVPVKPGYFIAPVNPSRTYRDGQNTAVTFALR